MTDKCLFQFLPGLTPPSENLKSFPGGIGCLETGIALLAYMCKSLGNSRVELTDGGGIRKIRGS